MKRGIGLTKMAIFSHLHSVPVLERFLSEYCHKVWCGNTRMVCPTDGEKLTKICLFVSAEYTNVTDTRTDRQTDRHTDRDHMARWPRENFTVHSTEFLARLGAWRLNVYPACCMRLRHCHSILRNLNHSGFLLSAFCSKCLKLISLASAKNYLISLMF